MNPKLEEVLASIEDLANGLAQEDDAQAKRTALILHVLASGIYVDQDEEILRLLYPLQLKLYSAAKKHNII